VRWADPRTALEPGPEETGCWSGSVVRPDDGPPVIVYTSVPAASMQVGRVALATGDAAWRRWTPDPAGPVLLAPPAELDLADFRDPFLWREGERWAMAVGAGRSDGGPAVLRYSSDDLRAWHFDGLLAEAPAGGGPGGAVWECPQLIRLDAAWVLLVSVWDGGPAGVAGAVGDLDGVRFVPRRWQPVAPDPLYATTTFDDAAGRHCALSWLQDDGPPTGPWAGALSVPWLLGRDGDRITVAPHPDVDTLRTRPLIEEGARRLSGPPLVIGPVGPYLDLGVEVAGGSVRITLAEEGTVLASLTVDPAGPMRVEPVGRPEVVLAAAGAGRVLVDAGVLEVFAGGAARAARVAATGAPVTLTAAAVGDDAELRRLRVHEMAPVLG
jgi:beta-fructofuranosidase